MAWFSTLVYALTILFYVVSSSPTKGRDVAPRLRLVVNALQEQVVALQREQQHNRMVIQALEIKLEDELSSRNRDQVLTKTDSGDISLAKMQFSPTPGTTKRSVVKPSFHPDLLSPEDQMIHKKQQDINSTFPNGQVKSQSLEDKRAEDLAKSPFKVMDDSTSDKNWTPYANQRNLQPTEEFPLSEEQLMISRMGSDLAKLRSDLGTTAQTPADVNLKDVFRSELESIRTELQKLRHDVETQKSKFDNQESQFEEMRSGRITTKWLQKTVVDVRKEVSELAAALNISMALREGQQLEALMDSVRGDILNLRSDLVHNTAGMTKQAATIDELKSELQEVRSMTSTITTDYQQLTDEVSALKEELFTSEKNSQEKQVNLWEEGSFLQSSGADGSGDFTEEPLVHYRGRGERRLAEEIQHVKESIGRLQQSSNLLNKDLHALRHDHSSAQAGLDTVQRTMSQLDNRTTQMYEEQCLLSKSMDDANHRLVLTEENISKNKQNIVNITETMTGMDKVHSSTIQLFEALEGLENDFSNNIGDLQKEISKFEFNVAQVQGSFDILRHDQSSHFQELKSLKMDLSRLNQEFRNDHFRLTVIQNEFLNRSLQKCVDGKDETVQALKLSNLELQLNRMNRREEDAKHQANVMYTKLLQKADRSALQNLEMSYRNMMDDTRNASSQLANVTLMQIRMRQEMMKFIRQLPSDCSFENVPNPARDYYNGVYLIHIPPSPYAKEVYCDLTTSLDRRWTLIQRRTDGTEDFARSWDEYKQGFGKPTGEYWFGNDDLHILTRNRNYTLRIDMWDIFNRYLYAEYSNFRVASEEELYRLDIGEYNGNASDSLRHHNSMPFSTHDKDNDASSTHCAMYYSAGWWYQHCQYVNINGRYAIGMTWYDETNKDWVQLTKVEMKISLDDS